MTNFNTAIDHFLKECNDSSLNLWMDAFAEAKREGNVTLQNVINEHGKSIMKNLLLVANIPLQMKRAIEKTSDLLELDSVLDIYSFKVDVLSTRVTILNVLDNTKVSKQVGITLLYAYYGKTIKEINSRLAAVQSVVDDHMQQISDHEYLNVCNELKDLYNLYNDDE